MYGRNVIESCSNGFNNWMSLTLNVLILIGFIYLITILIKKLMNYTETNKLNQPLEELKMRLARGEIDEKEYNKIKELI